MEEYFKVLKSGLEAKKTSPEVAKKSSQETMESGGKEWSKLESACPEFVIREIFRTGDSGGNKR